MSHKRRITVLLVVALLVAWGVTSSSQWGRHAPNTPAGAFAMLEAGQTTAGAVPTAVGASLTPGPQKDMPQGKSAPASDGISVGIMSYSDALLPAYETVIRDMASAPRYDIAVMIDGDMQHLHGVEDVVYTNHASEPLHELMLRLYPNTDYMGGNMHVEDVRVNAATVVPALYFRPVLGASISDTQRLTDTSVLSIPLASPLLPGHVVSLSLTFILTIPMQTNSGYRTFGWADQVLALPNAYAMIPVYDQLGWRVDPAPNYGDIVFAEASLFKVQFTAPSDLVIVATGVCRQTLVDQKGLPQTGAVLTMTTLCIAGPVRDFAIHASRMYRVLSKSVTTSGGIVLVTSYYLPGNQQAAQRVLEYASAALLFFESRFGVYPYKELKVFPSATTAGGIEYPMLAGVLDTLYSADPVYLEWIVAHEVSHQWWYGMVGSDPINEPWLDESLAQYSTLLYTEHRYGADFALGQREQRMILRYHAELDIGKDTVVDQPTSGYERALYFPIVYGKGPLFYDEVRRYVGDAQFTLWLHTYFERHHYGIVHRDDLLAVADDLGMGVIVRQAFNKWMHGLFIR